MPVLVLAVPIIDTATVVVIRLREGRPIYVGDRRHLSHRLVALGFSPRAAVLVHLPRHVLPGPGRGDAERRDRGAERRSSSSSSWAFVALILILLFVERGGEIRSGP